MDETDYDAHKARALTENPHGLTFDEAMEAFMHYFTPQGRVELNDYLAFDMQRELGELAVQTKGMRGKGRKHILS
jgi:hypothetical protein